MDIVNKNVIVHIAYGTFEKSIVAKKKTTKYSPRLSTMYPTKYPKLYYVGGKNKKVNVFDTVFVYDV